MSDQNRSLKDRLARQQAERGGALAAAKATAHAQGKQPFDLDAMYAAWPSNPDARDAANGLQAPLEDRLRDWETLYYLRYSQITTIEAFAAKMIEIQRDGAFD